MKYTKRQIMEAISYWTKQLRRMDENNSQTKNLRFGDYAKKGLSMMSRVPGRRSDIAVGRLQKAQGINPRDAARRASANKDTNHFLGENENGGMTVEQALRALERCSEELPVYIFDDTRLTPVLRVDIHSGKVTIEGEYDVDTLDVYVLSEALKYWGKKSAGSNKLFVLFEDKNYNMKFAPVVEIKQNGAPSSTGAHVGIFIGDAKPYDGNIYDEGLYIDD